MPIRIQRKRAKGWRMPKNCIYVGRPTKWGNPFMIGMMSGGMNLDRSEAVKEYILWLKHMPENNIVILAKKELRGKNLACFCPLDVPCHADVLLEVANA